MRCIICHEDIVRSCIGSCTHHFCYQCLVKWCKQKNTCPICNEIINEIRYDPEFDSLNNQSITDIVCLFDENKKILDFTRYYQLPCFT